MKSLIVFYSFFVIAFLLVGAANAEQKLETDKGQVCVAEGLVVNLTKLGGAFGSTVTGVDVSVPNDLLIPELQGQKVDLHLMIATDKNIMSSIPSSGEIKYDTLLKLHYSYSKSPRGYWYWSDDSANQFEAFCSEFSAISTCSRKFVKDGLIVSYGFSKSSLEKWADFDARVLSFTADKEIKKC